MLEDFSLSLLFQEKETSPDPTYQHATNFLLDTIPTLENATVGAHVETFSGSRQALDVAVSLP